jgi:hypothetical protein
MVGPPAILHPHASLNVVRPGGCAGRRLDTLGDTSFGDTIGEREQHRLVRALSVQRQATQLLHEHHHLAPHYSLISSLRSARERSRVESGSGVERVPSLGPVATSDRHQHTDVPSMRPASPIGNPPPRPHASSSRPPRSSSVLAPPHVSDVGALGSTVTA